MLFLKEDFLKLLPSNNPDTRPSFSRLTNFISEYFASGKINLPKGLDIT